MNIFLVICHPDPESFTMHTAERIVQSAAMDGNTLFFHNLYTEKFRADLTLPELKRKYSFDPLVQKHMKEIKDSDYVVILHPDWWGQPPALLKGWIDRVMQPGFAYEYKEGFSDSKKVIPLLTGKKALVGITTERKEGPLPITGIWEKTIFNFIGITDVSFQILYNTRHSLVQERDRFIKGIVNLILSEGSTAQLQ